MMNESLPSWMQRAMAGEYVEDYELRRYLWRHYHHALTDRERGLYSAALLELKARNTSSAETAARLRQTLGCFFDTDVDAIAVRGPDAFQQECCERLLRDFAGQIYINRCDHCHRIVASPIACACLWCGAHWYERRSEMIARSNSAIYPKPK